MKDCDFIIEEYRISYFNIELKEPDNIVEEGEAEDDDDEEPAMALGCGLETGCKNNNGKIDHLLKSINESCVSFHRHSHGGVDTGGEGDVDEGHQDRDALQQGVVLIKDSK